MSCLCDWNPLSNHRRMKDFPPSRPPPRPPFISTAVPAAAAQKSKLPPYAPCRAPVCQDASGSPVRSWGAPGWPGPTPAQAASARPRTADLILRCPSRAWQSSSQTGGAWVRPAEPPAHPPAPPPGSPAPRVSSASGKVPSGLAAFKPGFVPLRGEGASGDAALWAPPAWQGLPWGLGSAIGFCQRCLKHMRGAVRSFSPHVVLGAGTPPQGFLPARMDGLAPRLPSLSIRAAGELSYPEGVPYSFRPGAAPRSALQGGVGHVCEPGPVLGGRCAR